MKQIAAEQLAYGIDGFHIDMLDQGFGKPYGCWCEHCRKRFADRYGHEMPDGPSWVAAICFISREVEEWAQVSGEGKRTDHNGAGAMNMSKVR